MKRLGTSDFDLKLPKTVYLVGSGPSVLQNYERIPDEAYTIALNGAVQLPALKSDLWFAHCQRNFEQDWWEETYKNYQGTKFFGSFITEAGYPSEYYFNFHEDLLKFGVRTGITVAGIAFQMALLLGARNIIVTGLDMGGETRYDGVPNPKNSPEKWDDIVVRFNSMLKSCQRNIEYSTCSLGFTRLEMIQI